MTDVDTFLDGLRDYIAEEETRPQFGSDFYHGLIEGTLSREQVKAWALNLYYVTGEHIRAFGGIFMNTGLRPIDQKIRRHIVENLIDEETSMGRGDDAHWMLSLRLAQALGASDEEALRPRVAAESVEYVDWVIDLSRREHGMITLAAMSIGGESRSGSAMPGLVRALRENYALSRSDLEFFYAHMGEAEAHAKPVFEMVREYATTPDLQEKIRTNVKTWCEKFGAALEGGYRVAMGLDPGVEIDLG